MLTALGTQNRYFKLGLDDELGGRMGDLSGAWRKSPEGVTAGALLK